MAMAALAVVVFQGRGIKFYGATSYHGQRFSCGLQLHRPDIVRILNAGSLRSVKLHFSFPSALEKEDLLDRLGSRLVISANNSD